MIPDARLQHDVLAELEFEPRVNAAHIGVAARDGVVTLSGHVASFEEKLAAERAAQQVKGVRAVAQEIEVRLAADRNCADDEIAARALKILDWTGALPPGRVYVRVDDGLVTLRGEVDNWHEKEAAETQLRRLSGVLGVVNEIRIGRGRLPPGIAERIAAALKRNAGIDAGAITVVEREGRIALTGHSRNPRERDTAERIARSIRGVAAVDNRITVEPR